MVARLNGSREIRRVEGCRLRTVLYLSLRHLVSLSGWRLLECTRVRTTALHERQK